MVRKKSNRKLIITASIIGVVLVAVVTVVLIKAMNSNKNDPYVLTDTSSNSSSVSDTASKDSKDTATETEKPTSSTNTENEPESTLDPATVATVDITPMNLTVSYVKGVGGFEYEVRRTPSGSQYVEFKSPELAGTKCTNDAGSFASILADPSSSEGSTITKSKTVDGTTYGLSLAAANCTSDAAKLQKYQQSFSDAFSLLKKSS